jgi:hypothetical protein
MKLKNTILAALAIMSTLTAQAAPNKKNPPPPPPPPPIPISSLPFSIPGPGTYVLTRNLSYPATEGVANPVAIGLNVPPGGIGGPIIIDFKGFTITCTATSDLQSRSEGIRIASDQDTLIPITIRNGTLASFNWGAYFSLVHGITINNMTFSETPIPLTIIENPSATINNCNF